MKQGILRKGMAAAFAVLMLAGGVATADAASRICRQLEGQLSQASRGGGGGGGGSGRYARAAEAQRRQLAAAREQERDMECSRGGGRPCRSIAGIIARMERNLASIERQSSGRSSGGGRARILAALDANGCRDAPVRERRRDRDERLASRDESFLGRLLGSFEEPPLRRRERDGGFDRERDDRQRGYGGRYQEDGDDRTRIRSTLNPLPPGFADFGTVRTMCVRTCDGYFFPMSSGSSPDVLDRDQKACDVMCPGSEVRLYTLNSQEAESEDMVSLDGQPYTALPTAFAYKNAAIVRPQGCSCQARQSYAVVAGAGQDGVEAGALPLPSPRPDPGASAEMHADVSTGLSAEFIARILAPRPSDIAETADKRVRVVGPMFLPDQAEAIDLRAPVPTEVQ